jgi:hypothetical protein
MSFRLALPVAAALFLAACTPMQWARDDVASEALRQDMAQCRQEAWREARLRSWYYGSPGPVFMRDSLGRRFLAWPATRFGDPFGDPFFEQSRLEHFCMRAKGYRLEALEEPKK